MPVKKNTGKNFVLSFPSTHCYWSWSWVYTLKQVGTMIRDVSSVHTQHMNVLHLSSGR